MGDWQIQLRGGLRPASFIAEHQTYAGCLSRTMHRRESWTVTQALIVKLITLQEQLFLII